MVNSYNEISIPDIKLPDQSQGINNAPIEDFQLQVWNNREISGMQYFAMTINCTAGATADWMARVVNLLWLNLVQEASYSQEILVWLGSTTATFTKTYTIDTPVNSIFKVPPWKIIDITVRLSTATSSVIMDYTWTMRYLKCESGLNTMTSVNNHIIMMNSNTSIKDVTLKFRTSAADRPTFGIFIRIY